MGKDLLCFQRPYPRSPLNTVLHHWRTCYDLFSSSFAIFCTFDDAGKIQKLNLCACVVTQPWSHGREQTNQDNRHKYGSCINIFFTCKVSSARDAWIRLLERQTPDRMNLLTFICFHVWIIPWHLCVNRNTCVCMSRAQTQNFLSNSATFIVIHIYIFTTLYHRKMHHFMKTGWAVLTDIS